MRRISLLAASLATLVAVALIPSTGHASTPTFAQWVKAGTGLGEPGITEMADGTLLMDALQGAPSHSRLYRSKDAGATWQELSFGSAFGRLPGGGDTSVAVRGKTIYFLDLWAGSNSIEVSNDEGDTWAYGSPVSTIPPTDRQWLALGPHDPTTGFDTVYALYQQIGTAQQFVSVSHTSGATWEEPLPSPSLDDTRMRGFPGKLLSDENQFLTYDTENGGVLRDATSTDGGVSWAVHTIADNVYSGTLTGYARDASTGTLYASWVHFNSDDASDPNNYAVMVSSSTDSGATWSAPAVVSDANTTNIFTSVAARDGKVGVVWYGTKLTDANGNPVVMDPNNVPDATVWTANYSEYTGGLWSTQVVVGPGKTGIICTHGLSCPNLGSTGRELGDFLSITMDHNDKALVTFGGSVTKGDKFAREL